MDKRHNQPMAATTTLTLNEDQLLMLANAMEAEFTHHFTEEELKAHDKLHARIVKAYNRID